MIDKSTPEGYKYDKDYDIVSKREQQYKTNRSQACALIYGQCTQAMKNKLANRSDYNDIQEDPIKLLIALRETTHHYEDKRYAKSGKGIF